jgi:hypothetical protein
VFIAAFFWGRIGTALTGVQTDFVGPDFIHGFAAIKAL